MKPVLLILLMILIGSSATATAVESAEPMRLRAGAARLEITPEKLPVIVNGSMLERVVEEVNDPLYTRALVLDNGQQQLAMVLVDSCMMPRDLLDRAKELAAGQTGLAVITFSFLPRMRTVPHR